MNLSKMKHISTISFGKDSSVMNHLLLKNNFPVDHIIFTDTLMEFPMMYEYKKKLTNHFKERFDKEIIITKPNTTFEEWCFGTIRKVRTEDKKYLGAIRGIPMVWAEPCYWKREAKTKPQEQLLKKLIGKAEYTTYIGFTLDESTRRMDGGGNFLYPLIDDFKMTERNCQEYMIDNELENPLYRFFTRTGCGVCTGQSDKAWYQVWKNFPDTWKYMKWVQDRLLTYQDMGMKVKNAYWFTDYKTCQDMEQRFIRNEMQGSLMDFSDEPLKDCFCKI